jgi:lysyl-tRNA synthetase class 2
MNWQPNARLAVLQARATLLAQIRQFFHQRQVLEVETPALSRAAVPEPMIEPLATECHGVHAGRFYLHTSPELMMKRLLAAGSGSIYQICTVFRDHEAGRWHNPEFRLLEWYRLDFDHHQLMAEVSDLLQTVLRCEPAQKISYTSVFQQHLAIDPLTAPLAVLQKKLQHFHAVETLSRDACLQALFSQQIEPAVGFAAPLMVYDYPLSQAALARSSPDNPALASRFEVYVNGVELANGFHELCDADEQRRRFQVDLQKRQQNQQVILPLDEHFLAALAAGLPDCAGVALGVDRLLMLKLGLDELKPCLSFAIERV